MEKRKTIEEQKREILESVPEDRAEQIREMAASISGRPKEEITLEEAMEIFQEDNDPEIDEQTESFFENMTPEEEEAGNLLFEQFRKAGSAGQLAEITKKILDAEIKYSSSISTEEDLVQFFQDWAESIENAFVTELEEPGLKLNPELSGVIHSFVDAMVSEAIAGVIKAVKGRGLEILPLTSVIPQKHLIPNNKLANQLTEDIIDAGAYSLVVSSRGKKEIVTICVLSYEGDDITLTSKKPFTEYDRQVADAVTSLYEYGDEQHVITPAMVYRTMIHATDTETPSPQQISAVTQSLDKMRFVRVQVDCSNELRQRNLSLNGDQITGGKIDTYLLDLRKEEVIAGGQRVTAYRIKEKPIIYAYSQLIGQVMTVSAKLLDVRDETGARVANTERRIEIKGYLLRRIERMKGKAGNRQSRHILYTDIYKSICDGEPTDKEKRNIKSYIPQVLEYWKRSKYIKGYAEITEKRKKTGIEIMI